MRIKVRHLFEIMAVGAAAVVVAQEPLFSPTPRAAPKTTAAPSPTITPGTTPTPAAAEAPRGSATGFADARLPIGTPRAIAKPLPYRQPTAVPAQPGLSP
jgi:hypothetical protein